MLLQYSVSLYYCFMYMVVDQNEKIHALLCSSVECTVMTLQIILHKFVFVHPLFPIVTNCKVNSQKMPYVFRFLTFCEAANTIFPQIIAVPQVITSLY